MKKIRHHYVPQALTRNFSFTRKILFLYDFREQKIIRTSTKDLFVEKNLYTIPITELSPKADALEDLIAQLEDRWCQSIYSLTENGTLTDEERYHISNFIAIQYTRTPVVQQKIAGTAENIIGSQIRARDKLEPLPIPSSLAHHGKSVAELIDQGLIKVKPNRNFALQALCNFNKIAEVTFSMDWTFLECDENLYFIISDNPCSIFDPNAQRSGYGQGLASETVELVLPFHRNRAILAHWNERKRSTQNRKIFYKQVREINRRSAYYSERFFAYPIESKSILRQLTPFGNSSPSSSIERINTGDAEYIVGRNNVTSDEGARKIYKQFRSLTSN